MSVYHLLLEPFLISFGLAFALWFGMCLYLRLRYPEAYRWDREHKRRTRVQRRSRRRLGALR